MPRKRLEHGGEAILSTAIKYRHTALLVSCVIGPDRFRVLEVAWLHARGLEPIVGTYQFRSERVGRRGSRRLE